MTQQAPFAVEVPATTANVGVGFDCLGLALDLWARFTFETASETAIDGCPERFRGRDNLVWTSYVDTCHRLHEEPLALHVTIESPIPLSGGLGSSSACVVAGIIAAQVLHSGAMDAACALDIACELEGHPDNVAPALLGGLVSSFVDGKRTQTLRLDVADDVRMVAIAPPYEVRTADARKVMPHEVPLETVVWQTGRAIAAVHALEVGNLDLFSRAAQDRLHEPYRAPLIEDYAPLRRCALAAGAAAYLISGSGSTMLAVCAGEEVAARVERTVRCMAEGHLDGLWTRVLPVSPTGALVGEA